MPNEEGRPNRRRRKTEVEPAPEFPPAGTPASTPEDRDLFGDVAPDVEAVEEQVAIAEAIIDEKIFPPTGLEGSFNESGELDLSPGASHILAAPDQIEAAQKEAMLECQRIEMTELLERIQELTAEHSKIAVLNSYRGISSDFNTLGNAAKHIEKRIGDYAYLTKRGS